MAIQNQGNNPRLLQEGVNAIAGASYEMYNPEWASFLKEHKSNKAYELDVYKSTYKSAQLKAEGTDITTDTANQLYTSTFINAVYGIGTEITFEAIQNNQYEDAIAEAGMYLEESLQEAEQIVAADLINNGDGSALAGDGLSVFNTAHINKTGTFANKFSAFQSLSEASLQDMCIAMSRFKNAAGIRIKATPEVLCVPPDLEFTADRLLNSTLQAETGNNAINAVRKKFSKGYAVNHYFTDTGKYFIVAGNVRNGGKFFRRMDHTFQQDNSNTNTLNHRSIGITYFSVGVTDPRAYYGSGSSS